MGPDAVWHVSDCFAGGVATHVRQLRGLLPDVEHRVLSLGDNYDAALMGGPADVTLPFRRSNPLGWRAAAKEVAGIVPPQAVLHAHSTLGGWVGAMAARKSGHRRLVYTPHAHFRMRAGKAVENAILTPFEKALFAGLRGAVVACGRREHELMLRQLPGMRAVLIPHALGPEPASKSPRNGVCFIGRLEGQKRPVLAAEVMVRAKVPGVLVGRGALKPEVGAVLAGQDLVRQVDRVEDARALLRQSKALLMTSSYEVGVPYVVLEAWACGAAVAAVPAPGVDEALETGAAVALPEDPDAAAVILRAVVEGRRQPARDPKGLPFLDESGMAQAYRDLYRSLVADA